jgi:gamma-glutamyl:cysteine ligase YbdK (ATP-grasp superfamily)
MPHPLFSVFGVEIEYAVIRRRGGGAAPVVSNLLSKLGGSPDAHPAFGEVELDNELAAHVLELKARRPAPRLLPLLADFQAAVASVNATLAELDAGLLPGGMHPFMDPARESQLWDYEDNSIYAAYDRIFGCRGHGWFNVQSVHLNLPFSGDAEFSQLHNAVSLLLPLLPALAAASPIWDGKPGPWLDGRLFHYAGNQKKLPEITGPLIPEPVQSETEYRERILEPMYRAIAPFDPEGLLQEEWLNSRAAIARFDRSAIEIRCLDTQENPRVDLALCHFIACALKAMIAAGLDLHALHRGIPEGVLRGLFLESARAGRAARVPDPYPSELFGKPRFDGTAGGLFLAWLPEAYRHSAPEEEAVFRPVVEGILKQGNFAERMLRQWGEDPNPGSYCDWLQERLQAYPAFADPQIRPRPP